MSSNGSEEESAGDKQTLNPQLAFLLSERFENEAERLFELSAADDYTTSATGKPENRATVHLHYEVGGHLSPVEGHDPDIFVRCTNCDAETAILDGDLPSYCGDCGKGTKALEVVDSNGVVIG